MNQIKFSHEYHKLPERMPFTAQLLQCFKIHYKELSESFIIYDTGYFSGEYPLSKTDLIVLLLCWEGHLFTTIRRYTPEKWKYYISQEGQHFEIVKG